MFSLIVSAVSSILQTWAKCLCLAGFYSRAEFALKASATPNLFAKGELAACSLGISTYSDLIANSIFGVSRQSTPAARVSRPGSRSRPASSGLGSTGRDEDGMRRPVSGGLMAARFTTVDINDVSRSSASLVTFSEEAANEDAVRDMMLQKDCEDDDDHGIAFHNIRSVPSHPECMSWIDVALAASGVCVCVCVRACVCGCVLNMFLCRVWY